MGLRDTGVGWLKGLAACLLATALLGAGQCSYRGHTWGGSVSGTTTQTSIGPISLFGSVAVGGIEYTTSAASVTIDDFTAFEPQLEVGQLATLTGSVDASGTTGTATAVAVKSKLIGPVSAVDLP